MEYSKLQPKGVAGLNIFLSLIAMIFMIGVIVMVFVLAGSNLEDTLDATDDADARLIINDTYQSLSDTTDWFSTFIVLGAMVVLILLVVIIINSIRGAGITGGA